MDEFIGQLARFLSNTVVLHLYSYPHFAVEALLAAVLCVAHALLIREVNTLVARVNARAAGKLRLRHAVRDADSFCSYHHSLTTIQPRGYFSKRLSRARCFEPLPPTAAAAAAAAAALHRHACSPPTPRQPSVASHLGWAIRCGDVAFARAGGGAGAFDERVERLLATTPSEYVRRDKDRKSREAGLRSCLQSLTSLLERALDGDRLDLEDEASKETLRRSINAIRETFESRVSAGDGYDLGNFPSASLQSLIAQSTARRALESSLGPNRKPSTMAYPVTDVYMKNESREADDDGSKGDSAETFDSLSPRRSCDDLNELFRQDEQLAESCSKTAMDAAY